MVLHRTLSVAFACACLSSLGLAQSGSPTRKTDSTGVNPDSARFLPRVAVIASADALAHIAGSGSVIGRTDLKAGVPLTAHDALRYVPGVLARDEEGLGLRPNFGIRGLSPTRSSKVLLLEDGLPFVIAPYGDNASYYHPPLERFDRIEVLKGSGQIRFGPHTIGGVINYVTPVPGAERDAELRVVAGTAGFRELSLRAAAPLGPAGVYVGASHRASEGTRAFTGSQLDDVFAKGEWRISSQHRLGVRVNAYRERSNVTYSGLTEAEWASNPLGNAFRNDSMLLDRTGAALQHSWIPAAWSLTTSVYAYRVQRNWWRQSSNSAQRPNDASDPACGGMANLSTTCGNEGRLRTYVVSGVEPRLTIPLGQDGSAGTFESGARLHVESQWRRQVNGASPLARTAAPVDDVNGGLREANRRDVQAASAFAELRLTRGPMTVTPGVRVERVRLERENRLVEPTVRGMTTLTEWIPGVGATWLLAPGSTLFAGVHRGFAPPRPEDVIDGSSGSVVELDPERSWNYEAGLRWQSQTGIRAAVTAFWLDFSNQIIPQSLAGGSGAALTSAGRTIHGGIELDGRVNWGLRHGHRSSLYSEAALTLLPVAEFAGTRYVFVGQSGSDVSGKVYAGQNAQSTRRRESVTGKRLPYAPKATLTAALGYLAEPFELRAEGVFVGRQFSDALNTDILVADAQQGPIAGTGTLNVSANVHVPLLRSTAFLAVRNAFDRLYIADRSRGLSPGATRLVRLGLTRNF